MSETPAFDVREFASSLDAMTDDELFAAMRALEKTSEDIARERRQESDVFARIALTETAIEERFPGQFLTPYRAWKQRRMGP